MRRRALLGFSPVRGRALFVVATAPPAPGGGLFAGAPLGLAMGAVAGPLQASSRSHLARLVPAEEAGRWFGLLSLSGKLTSFLGPLAAALATELSGAQAAGPAVLVAFFGAGAPLFARAGANAGSGGVP